MVNTFLVCVDYVESARHLNYRNHVNATGRHGGRLWKQVLEARQIIQAIEDLHMLAHEFNMPLPKKPKHWKTWARQIFEEYKSLDYVYVETDHGFIQELLPPGKTWTQRSKQVHSAEGWRVVKLGWSQHCATRQWYGHVNALKEYCDAHQYIWQHERGGKCKYTPYGVKDAPRPDWTVDEKVHKVYRAALLDKEITRGEDPWYIKNKLFDDAEPFVKYIWSY